MTIHVPIRPNIYEKDFVLATDLDGTFLGGTAADREELYNWIEDNRATVGLIFVTGRHPEFIHEHCDTYGIPIPEYVIADVGTTIAQVFSPGVILPNAEFESPIAKAWQDKADPVQKLMQDIDGLTLQDTPFRHRLSYNISPEGFNVRDLESVRALGVDVLVSDNRFVDVLPEGVSKGPTLRRLIDSLGIAPHRVLAAGDTLNDMSMLTADDLFAVAVGGSEQALYDALPESPRIHRARGEGAAGILEAIAAFNLHPTPGSY
ncbi:HAD-IIB family hydrolase [Marivita sp. XM-24bin2]|jgi:HAD superfamily hydrolase (TIGR01484 family)|uniref:HAD-IIB family hydrolase n=1 Tax=unclassified Marivita TaxID=2632480 RepID=UPI000D7AB455|nr:HAD-IIB family hydrolase [Marivita sp. XM-24bin2]MCR9109705.1 HAD family hydrolase [Paracoccaceae bacterium]PWL35016.1 MAG: alpha,alpha-trehalose-phosphate synthase [Marivita sp. XM-24bin2]